MKTLLIIIAFFLLLVPLQAIAKEKAKLILTSFDKEVNLGETCVVNAEIVNLTNEPLNILMGSKSKAYVGRESAYSEAKMGYSYDRYGLDLFSVDSPLAVPPPALGGISSDWIEAIPIGKSINIPLFLNHYVKFTEVGDFLIKFKLKDKDIDISQVFKVKINISKSGYQKDDEVRSALILANLLKYNIPYATYQMRRYLYKLDAANIATIFGLISKASIQSDIDYLRKIMQEPLVLIVD
jgi:hypothetical protein